MEFDNKKDWFYENTDLSANMEDYVETIALLSDEKRVVRVKDIAKRLNIKMPSVTNALDKLKDKALINYEKYGYIELTGEGKKVAAKIYKKHSCLADLFHTVFRMSKNMSNDEACRLEHHLSPEALKQVHKFINFYNSESVSGSEWVNKLKGVLDERLLSELKEGDRARIVKVGGQGDFRKRLLEMGFRKNVPVTVKKYAPLKDPILIEIKDFQVSLRVDEAKNIIVRLESGDD